MIRAIALMNVAWKGLEGRVTGTLHRDANAWEMSVDLTILWGLG